MGNDDSLMMSASPAPHHKMGGFGSEADDNGFKSQNRQMEHNSPITGMDNKGNKYNKQLNTGSGAQQLLGDFKQMNINELGHSKLSTNDNALHYATAR